MKKILLVFLLLPLFSSAIIPSTRTYDGHGSLIDFVYSIFSPNVATDYYISNGGSNSNSGTSTGSSWLTMSKVASFINAGSSNPGDRFMFAANDTFAGSVVIQSIFGSNAKSGTLSQPVIFSSYNSGHAPVFLYSGGGATAEDRITWKFVGVNYYTFDGWELTDTNHINDKKTGALCGFPFYFGSFGDAKCNHFTVRNCNISYCGMGISIYGDSCLFTHNIMNNFKDLKNNGLSNDYGSNPFTILYGNYNEISYNDVSGGWSQSDAFGFNGGFCEVFGSCSHNRVLYNKVDDTNGLSEFGGGGGDVCDSNWYVGNRFTNCGAFFYVNPSQVDASNIFLINNTQVELVTSRFSGSNCGHGLPDSAAIHDAGNLNCDERSLGYSGQSAPLLFISQNNIFQIETGMDVYNSGTGTQTGHTYNTYKLSGGSSINVTAGATEKTTSAAFFTQTTGTNPFTWNLRLTVGSIPYKSGSNYAGYPNDINGDSFDNNMGYLGNTGNVYKNYIIFPGPVKNVQ